MYGDSLRSPRLSVTTYRPAESSLSGIVTEAPDIDNIQRNIDRARQNYASAFSLLQKTAPARVSLPNLTEAAEEFGAQHAVWMLQDNPSRFGLQSPLTPAEAQRLTDVLATLNERTEVLDELFAQRENILCAADPTRLRRYCIEARECVIDPFSDKLTFLDDPERAYPLQPVQTQDSVKQSGQDLEAPGLDEPEDDEPSL